MGIFNASDRLVKMNVLNSKLISIKQNFRQRLLENERMILELQVTHGRTPLDEVIHNFSKNYSKKEILKTRTDEKIIMLNCRRIL